MTLLPANDPLFDEQATRTLAHAVHGGADFGECLTTMERVPFGRHRCLDPRMDRDCRPALRRSATRAPAHGNPRSARARRGCAPPTITAPPNVFLFGQPISSRIDNGVRARSQPPSPKPPRVSIRRSNPVEIPFEGDHAPRLFLLRRARFAPAAHMHQRLRFDGARNVFCVRGRGSPSWVALPAVRRTRPGPHVVQAASGHAPRLGKRGAPGRRFCAGAAPVSTRRASRCPAGASVAISHCEPAAGEPRLAACVADPGMTGLSAPMAKMFAALPASALADPLAADPALFAPYVQKIEATPRACAGASCSVRSWSMESLRCRRYLAAAKDYDTYRRPRARSVARRSSRSKRTTRWRTSAPDVFAGAHLSKDTGSALPRPKAPATHCAMHGTHAAACSGCSTGWTRRSDDS